MQLAIIIVNHILNGYLYGFRPSHSCQAQLISIVEELQLALDCHQQVDLIMLDFSKAFDTVPHQRLLSFYGIDGKLHHWLSTWLTKRSQRIVVDGEYVSVLSGVPQGTVLGPVIFLLYINDINNNVSSSLRLFADDCIILFTVLLNLNKTTSNCSRTYILLMNGHSNGKCALTSANVLSLDVTESYHHLYLHIF